MDVLPPPTPHPTPGIPVVLIYDGVGREHSTFHNRLAKKKSENTTVTN